MKDEPFRFKVAMKEERAFDESKPASGQSPLLSLREMGRFPSPASQTSNAEIEAMA